VGEGKEMFAELSRLKLEGMVAKRCDSLDGDVILAAQAIVSDSGRNEVVVATENPAHLFPHGSRCELVGDFLTLRSTIRDRPSIQKLLGASTFHGWRDTRFLEC
jgi:hypothetical protein